MEENKIQDQNTKKKKTDIKKTLRNMLVIVLVAVISIAGTLAYLSTLSNTETNTFTGSKGIRVKLDEPNYDSSGAGNYTPGKVITKNPILTNTTTEDNTATEWVAILVTYKYNNTEATYSQIQKVIKAIVYNNQITVNTSTASAISTSDYWQEIASTEIDDTKNPNVDSTKYALYMYCRTLGQNDSTDIALFDNIEIKDEKTLKASTNPDFYDESSQAWSLPKFDIIVQGAAIKNEYTKKNDSTAAATTWSELSGTDQTQLKKDLADVFYNNNLIPKKQHN